MRVPLFNQTDGSLRDFFKYQNQNRVKFKLTFK